MRATLGLGQGLSTPSDPVLSMGAIQSASSMESSTVVILLASFELKIEVFGEVYFEDSSLVPR
jgi:hypothetical protein